MSKTVIGWIAGGAISFVNIVFYFGVSKANTDNAINNDIKDLKELTIQNHNDMAELKKTFTDFTTSVNNKFNKMYDDEYNRWNDYQVYSKKQFELIIDYGSSNKKLMKDMLDMNHTDEMNKLKKEIEKNKNDISIKMMKIEIADTVISNNYKPRVYKIKVAPRDDVDTTRDSTIASTKAK